MDTHTVGCGVIVEDYNEPDEVSSIDDAVQLPKRGKHIKKWKDSTVENNIPSNSSIEYMETSGGRMKNSVSSYEVLFLRCRKVRVV